VLRDELFAIRREGGPLASLSESDVSTLSGEFVAATVPAGASLVQRGESSHEAYVVLRGRLALRTDDDPGGEAELRELCRGELLPPTAIPSGGRHAASVCALENCELAVLSRARFDDLLARDSESWRRISTVLLAWMRRSQLTTHLNSLFGTFRRADAESLRDLEADVEMRTLAGGETLFNQGELGDAAYVVLSGRLRVVAERPGQPERVLAEIGRGETVGELSLLTDENRSATVFAVRDSDLARISREGFLRLIERRPQSLRPLARVIADRQRRRNTERRFGQRAGGCTTLVPSGPSVRLDDFARDLVATLSQHGPAVLLSSADVDRAFGVPGISQSTDGSSSDARLKLWLHEREESHRFVVYQADTSGTPWTERCARQADCVLTVADATANPEPSDGERRLSDRWTTARAPQRRLLLLHPPELDRPRGTSRWLRDRDVDAVYHLRRGNPSDIARLARIVAGSAVGLVLGGGGGRGFAHLGVIRALEELGIAVDMVGGASIGAAVSLPCAMGRTAAEGLDMAEQTFRSLLDYTLPIASLLAGHRITRAIERNCRDWDIEDLWLPYYCVSTDITTGRVVSHRRGSLLRAVRASVAIPGVLPPVPDGESLLVDGGVLNNLPIDSMREMNPTGIVIAVDVMSPRGPRAREDYGLSISGWRLMVSRLNPFTRTTAVPGLITTIMRSMFVGSDGTRERMLQDGLADLYLSIRAPGVGLLQFDSISKTAQLGYEGSIEPLSAWAAQQGWTKGLERNRLDRSAAHGS